MPKVGNWTVGILLGGTFFPVAIVTWWGCYYFPQFVVIKVILKGDGKKKKKKEGDGVESVLTIRLSGDIL